MKLYQKNQKYQSWQTLRDWITGASQGSRPCQTNKTNTESAKVWNCTKKTKKTNPDRLSGPGLLEHPRAQDLARIFFCFLLVQFHTFALSVLVLLVLLVQLHHLPRNQLRRASSQSVVTGTFYLGSRWHRLQCPCIDPIAHLHFILAHSSKYIWIYSIALDTRDTLSRCAYQ